jgi:excisionase family DNA binding protein
MALGPCRECGQQVSGDSAVVKSATSPPQVLFTFAEAAEMTALRESWLRKAVSERRIPFRRIGKHIRFAQADLDALVSDNAVGVTRNPLPPSQPSTRRRQT